MTNETKQVAHTPGPWKVLEQTVDGMHQALKIGPGFTGNWEKCIIQTPSGSQTLMAIGKANAQLIAAAPELLEALKYILGHSGTALTANDLGKIESLHNIKGKALEAINKARGGV